MEFTRGQRVQHIETGAIGHVLDVIESRSPYNPGLWINIAYESGVTAVAPYLYVSDATPATPAQRAEARREDAAIARAEAR
jgi:hypothetical protein